MRSHKPSLTTAVINGDTETVQSLLTAGADVNEATSGGQTPLILAIVFTRIQILSLLLEAGADPKLRDGLGLNAVDWAERRGFTEGAKLLAQTRAVPQRESPARIPESPNLRSSMTPQIEEPNTPATKESKKFSPATKTGEAESETKKVEPQVVVEHGSLPVQLPTPEFTTSTDCITKVAAETFQVKDESHSERTMPVEPFGVDAKAEHPHSPIAKPSMSSSFKQCPKCKTTYKSELLWYCAIDMTPLVDVNKPVVAPPPETPGMPLVWVLVVLIFVIASGITYLLIPNFKSEQSAPPAIPAQAIDRTSPLVGGELSGKQLNVPEAQYPASAKSAHVSGKVTVQVSVDKNGTVISTKVLEGDRRLRSAAVAAAQGATFSAEKLTGQAAVGTIVYTFKE